MRLVGDLRLRVYCLIWLLTIASPTGFTELGGWAIYSERGVKSECCLFAAFLDIVIQHIIAHNV